MAILFKCAFDLQSSHLGTKMRPTEQCVRTDQAQIRRHLRREVAGATWRHALHFPGCTMLMPSAATSRTRWALNLTNEWLVTLKVVALKDCTLQVRPGRYKQGIVARL